LEDDFRRLMVVASVRMGDTGVKEVLLRGLKVSLDTNVIDRLARYQ